MFLVSKSQPYGFQCEKTNKKNTTYPAYVSASISFFLVEQTFFFLLDQKEKKGFIGSGGNNFFQGMIF